MAPDEGLLQRVLLLEGRTRRDTPHPSRRYVANHPLSQGEREKTKPCFRRPAVLLTRHARHRPASFAAASRRAAKSSRRRIRRDAAAGRAYDADATRAD